MPVIVKEIFVRTNVSNDNSMGNVNNSPSHEVSRDMKTQKDLIISECVEQVLFLLREENER